MILYTRYARIKYVVTSINFTQAIAEFQEKSLLLDVLYGFLLFVTVHLINLIGFVIWFRYKKFEVTLKTLEYDMLYLELSFFFQS